MKAKPHSRAKLTRKWPEEQAGSKGARSAATDNFGQYGVSEASILETEPIDWAAVEYRAWKDQIDACNAARTEPVNYVHGQHYSFHPKPMFDGKPFYVNGLLVRQAPAEPEPTLAELQASDRTISIMDVHPSLRR